MALYINIYIKLWLKFFNVKERKKKEDEWNALDSYLAASRRVEIEMPFYPAAIFPQYNFKHRPQGNASLPV